MCLYLYSISCFGGSGGLGRFRKLKAWIFNYVFRRTSFDWLGSKSMFSMLWS